MAWVEGGWVGGGVVVLLLGERLRFCFADPFLVVKVSDFD